MKTAEEALRILEEGNRRFVDGESMLVERIDEVRRHELVAGQFPKAIILGCADARVPVEVIFDQGLGDLFVIRIAGNIVAPSQIGSIEFAAKEFGTRLVVVLGHTNCGAVSATLARLKQGTKGHTKNLLSIVDRIAPAIEPLIGGEYDRDPETLLREAVSANVRASVDQLRHGSPLLDELQESEGLVIVGAKYSLKRGVVDFLEH
jgi:carbonic anhydrase